MRPPSPARRGRASAPQRSTAGAATGAKLTGFEPVYDRWPLCVVGLLVSAVGDGVAEIFTSPLARAKQTADIVAVGVGDKPPVGILTRRRTSHCVARSGQPGGPAVRVKERCGAVPLRP